MPAAGGRTSPGNRVDRQPGEGHALDESIPILQLLAPVCLALLARFHAACDGPPHQPRRTRQGPAKPVSVVVPAVGQRLLLH